MKALKCVRVCEVWRWIAAHQRMTRGGNGKIEKEKHTKERLKLFEKKEKRH